MPKDNRFILQWMKRHGFNRKLRRLVGATYASLRNVANFILKLIHKHTDFFTCLLIAIIAALILAKVPWIGSFLATLAMASGVLLGISREIAIAFSPSKYKKG